jgi:hypothetical protein
MTTPFNGLKLVDGDISFSNGKVETSTGAEYAAQQLRSRLRVFFGEYFRDTKRGVPYREQIMTGSPDMTIISTIFINEFLKTPGLIKLTKFDVIPDTSNRSIKVEARYTTKDGIEIFNEVLP